jgi:hypothetical protein
VHEAFGERVFGWPAAVRPERRAGGEGQHGKSQERARAAQTLVAASGH